jgi:predicted Zn-dependent peptidase
MGPRPVKTILDNGVRIITHQIPHVRSVSMGVWVNVGARDETAQESGLSHFIEHMIFKGTAQRSAFQIAKEFDAIGGQTNAFTSMEHTCYHAKVLDTHLETMVRILSDIFLNSVFDAAEIEKERPVIFQEIGMVEDNPEEWVHQLASQNFWGDNPLGRSILGTRENIVAFDADKIKRFFRRLYQPNRIIVAAAGNLTHKQMVSLIANDFGSIQNQTKFPKRRTPRGRFRLQFHHKPLEQVHICMLLKGLSAADPRRFTLSLLNTILGGNMSSRIFQRIREQEGLAYTVYSFSNSHVDTGSMGVYTAVEDRNASRAVALVLEELARLVNQSVSNTELRDAKEFIKGNLHLAAESPDNQMVRVAQNEIYFGRDIPLETIIEGVEDVFADDICKLAGELLNPNNVSLTILGPERIKDAFSHRQSPHRANASAS